MFRWIVIPILMILIGGLVINEINKATATKAVAFQVPVVTEKQPVSNQPIVTGVVEISGSKTDGPVITPAGKPLAFQPLVISNARINAVERQEIPSEKEGKLLFVGTDVKPNRDVPAKDQFQLRIGYLLVEIEKDEQVPSTSIIKVPSRPEKIYRRWKEGDPLAPSKVYLDYENKTFFKLEVGDEVTEGQLVGLVNPVLALDDLSIRAAKLDASEADRRASEKTRDEAHKRFQQQALLRQKGAGSEEDYRSAELFWRRYIEEELGKASLVVQSQRELSASVTTLKMHEIRSTIPGVIKAIYKSRGEAIKNLEPVLQVQNRNRLRVEGLVEIQDSRAIQRDSKVIVEPSQPEQPKLVLRGHLLDVSCVSVCKGDSTIILSGSEDQSVRGWNASNGDQLWYMPFKSHVKALANNQGKNAVCAVGLADGSLIFFNPHQIKEPVRECRGGRHNGNVNSVLVTNDGEYAVSCGDDRLIYVWKTSNGEMVQKFESAHKSSITSLSWAGANQIISDGRDNAIYLWPFENGKISQHTLMIDRRSGDVVHLGASPDGKYVLFDQGKEIRVLNLADKHLEGVIQSQSGSSNFSNFAIFSPDSSTVMTFGGNDGKIQLWRSPVNNRRPAELRQLIWPGVATCAAFSPDGAFAVTGTQDHQVLIWDLPDRKEVEKILFANVRLIEPFLDSNSRQIRIWADMDNPGWIHPGGTATMVIPSIKAPVVPNR